MSERQHSVKRKSHVWLPSKRQNVPVGCCASAVLPGGSFLQILPPVCLLKRTQPTCFNEEYWQSVGRDHIYPCCNTIWTNIIYACSRVVVHYKSSDGAFWGCGSMYIFASGYLDSCLPFQPAPASSGPCATPGKNCLVLLLFIIILFSV